MKKLNSSHNLIIFFLVAGILLTSCSSKLYTVYYNPVPPEPKNYVDNISITEDADFQNAEVYINASYQAYTKTDLFSDQLMSRKVVANYSPLADWFTIIYPVWTAVDVLDFISFGLVFSNRFQKEALAQKSGFEDLSDRSVIYIDSSPQFGLSFVSFIVPFYTAPMWNPENKKYIIEESLVQDKTLIEEFVNQENKPIIGNLVRVPINIYCNNDFVETVNSWTAKIDTREIAIKEYEKGNDLLEFRVIVGGADYITNDVNEFSFTLPTIKFLPEKHAVKEMYNTSPSNADLYFEAGENEYIFVGKTPFEFVSEVSFSPQLPSRKIKIMKEGYKTIYKEIESSTKDREIRLGLEIE